MGVPETAEQGGQEKADQGQDQNDIDRFPIAADHDQRHEQQSPAENARRRTQQRDEAITSAQATTSRKERGCPRLTETSR